MLGLNMVTKEDNNKVFTLPPPLITHTEATPMGTPQGSPNEHTDREINRQSDTNSLTVEIPTVSTIIIVGPFCLYCAFVSSESIMSL